eukprot:m.222372 g.222372  ORF g.222372 m.222372 type:complete len:765 (-) comp16017_c0_seq1:86-2380(-)
MEFASPFAFVPSDEKDIVVEEIYDEDLEDADTSAAVQPAPEAAAVLFVAPPAAPAAMPAMTPAPPAFPPFGGAPGAPLRAQVDALADAPAPAASAGSGGGFFSDLFGSVRRMASGAPPPPAPAPAPTSAPEPRAKAQAKAAHLLRERAHRVQFGQRHEVDSNVVAFKCAQLASGAPIHTGDVVLCPGCQVALSSLSNIAVSPEGMTWTCEFCSIVTPLDLVPEEVPKQDIVDYIIRPAPTVVADQDEISIVFCIDISGSMCVSTPVEGRMALRGASRHGLEESVREHGVGAQYLPSERRGVTYVTRLQAVQAAVDAQIKAMSKEHPNRKVGLIAFNKEITLIGDGSVAPITLAGDTLSNPEALRTAALEFAGMTHAVKDSHTMLTEKLFGLEETSATALGPALLAAVTIAGRTRGSKVVMCTDGLANVGIGSLEGYDTMDAEGQGVVDGFYESLAAAAQHAGVAVSVISIIGEECKLERLGRVADVTGGDVARVSPLTLHKDFNSILAKPLLATNVSATMFLHAGLYFRNADADPRKNQFTIELGNVNEDSETFFDFGVRREYINRKAAAPAAAAAEPAAAAAAPAAAPAPVAEARAAAPAPPPAPPLPSQLTELPFQLHVKFTRLDGMECLRVITRKQPVTTSAAKANANINVAMYAAHVSQNASRMAEKGDFTNSRGWALGARRMVARQMTGESSTVQQAEYGLFDDFMNDMDRSARTSSARPTPVAPSASAWGTPRMQGRSDEEAERHYKAKKASSSVFKK